MNPIQNTDTLRAVGMALSNWSLVETQLARLFDICAGMHPQRKGYAVFDAIISFEVRLTICDRLMQFEDAPALEKEMWSILSKRLSKFYKKRHELAHFSMEWDYEKDDVSGIKPFWTWSKWVNGKDNVLKFDEIKLRSGKFIELHMAVGWFGDQAIFRKMPSEGGRQQGGEEPQLVPHIREIATRNLAALKPQPQSSLE